ncbi:nuclear transport factor 2 family protein [Luteipulveratus sp. YIM 133132]|uniref:nuclear transport factor 2 family protein n=1 Tax=Luteipulveratus flavus TaxID=3031728 RepID=UPI0023AF1212|nr:nuclear transport factor 2 family protein [Luteipulveratus sp. YIM 133132]MDE9365424.1 nuclear transport factor 2 family protein [Luteipulveratus sp. YIM 133132]
MTSHGCDPAAAFRAGVEARDLDAMAASLADDVRLFSPVKFRPFEGKAAVVELLGVLLRTFETFRYVGALAGDVEPAPSAGRVGGAPAEPYRDQGPAHALIFRATVQGKEIHGLDLLHVGPSGLIEEITVMVRPLSAAHTLSEAVVRNFEQPAPTA